jgi:hypothetical protein
MPMIVTSLSTDRAMGLPADNLIRSRNLPMFIILILAVLLSLGQLPALAKPMAAPNTEPLAAMPAAHFGPAIKDSTAVVIARYRGYQLKGPTDYMKGIDAFYQVEKVLYVKKGEKPLALKKPITIRYAFHDGSACIPEEGWQFKQSMMPVVGSQWILFLQKPIGKEPNKPYNTYRGDWGRKPATPENLEKIKLPSP